MIVSNGLTAYNKQLLGGVYCQYYSCTEICSNFELRCISRFF